MQKNIFSTKIFIFLSLIVISYSLVACGGSSSGAPTTSASNSLNNYFSKLNYVPINSPRLTSSNSPQLYTYFNATTTFTSLDVNFYSDNNCTTSVFESTIVPAGGQPFVTAVAGTYNTTDASNFSICSLYPDGCSNELSVKSIKYTYHYTAPVTGSTEYCLSNPSNVLPSGSSGEHIAMYTGTPAACVNIASCGYSQAYNMFVNPPVLSIAMQFTSLVPNGESATATISETGATTPITVNLAANNSNVSLSSSSCLINAPSTTSCSVQVSGITITGASTTITASVASFNLAESLVKVESPVVFITANNYTGNLNTYCQGAGCATDPESGVHGGDAICESDAAAAGLAGSYKAFLTASQRYACNSSGNCGAGNSADWPLLASTAYVLSNRSTAFGVTNSAQIFSFADSKVYPRLLKAAGGTSSAGFTWSGISSVKYSSNDITGWGYNSNNPSVPGNTPTIYTCNNWTNNSVSVAGSIGNNANTSNSAFTKFGTPTVGWYSNFTDPSGNSSDPYFNAVQPFIYIVGIAGSDPFPGPVGEGSTVYIAENACSAPSIQTALMCVQQ